MSQASAAEMTLKLLMTISRRFLKSTILKNLMIANYQRKAESGISAYIHTRSPLTAPFLPKKRIG